MPTVNKPISGDFNLLIEHVSISAREKPESKDNDDLNSPKIRKMVTLAKSIIVSLES